MTRWNRYGANQEHATLIISRQATPDGEVVCTQLLLDGGTGAEFWSKEAEAVSAAADTLNARVAEFDEAMAQWDDYRPARRSQMVECLAQAGRDLAEALFDGRQQAFHAELERRRITWLTVVSTGEPPSFAWDLLVLSAERKWLGERVMFGPCHKRRAPGDRFVTQYVRRQSFRAAFAEDNRLGDGRAELDAVQAVGPAPVDRLLPLPSGPVTGSGHDQLKRWLSQPRRLFHFKCHSSLPPRGRSGLADVGLRNDASANGQQLISSEANLRNAAVFLNMCGSATGRYSDRESLSRHFLEQHVPAVCGTTTPVSNSFATRFAEHFYGHAKIVGNTLRQALRDTRRELVASTGHPMALCYVFCGEPDFALRVSGRP